VTFRAFSKRLPVTAAGTVPADGGKVTFEIDKDDPQNPTGNRFNRGLGDDSTAYLAHPHRSVHARHRPGAHTVLYMATDSE